jgi:ectoine hydroxylase-related dioxygenase (phytanoyl-CoA dioxygenase family)
MKQYGISSFKDVSENNIAPHLESIKRKGFTVLKGILSLDECDKYSKELEKVYEKQEISFGKENLEKIQELDVARMPFAYDKSFLGLITEEKALELVREILGENFILQLQNGVINRNNKEHHQSSWHRDIPYQEYTTSDPISVNVFYCLSPFNNETGGTYFLPYSHLFSKAPSLTFFKENMLQPNLNAGDVIVFDSWVYHKAGYNSSDIVRYGINHVFTLPILKQQIDIPKMLGENYTDNQLLNKILGYTFDVKESVEAYRNNRLSKK